jgi:hypothetical protein
VEARALGGLGVGDEARHLLGYRPFSGPIISPIRMHAP